MEPGLSVEVEAAKCQNNIVELCLPLHKESSKFIKVEHFFVKGRVEIFGKSLCYSEKGQVLNVWVVFWVICNDVMHIMRMLPPTQ